MSGDSATSRAAAWWQLLRPANLFTAASNSIAGFLIAHGQWSPPGTLGLLVAASVTFYAAGMVLNDVFDAELDAVERPERPIPAGRVSKSAAAAAGWSLLALAVGLACLASVTTQTPLPALAGILLAAAIVLYNAVLKHTTAGPLAMGTCRALNVLLGASPAINGPHRAAAIAYAIFVGLYTASITLVARSEAVGAWARQLRIRHLVSRMIQGFIVIDAIAAALAAGWPSGVAVLALLAPTLLIARRTSMS